ncbi:hypothetical protein B005_1322 [Nocardiopsis alba ATCC BAA-2165]|uniref:Uncharacterized protein n=1 Tax=Nocardiopsis alba (strain ATCC BAA-2165 / BE74) TaxID=1205910 RepID=J7LBP9_NOCAA|nr:hypothetical protein B005_1322 [Nocardiopsis alba ATCC BAA-2165]
MVARHSGPGPMGAVESVAPFSRRERPPRGGPSPREDTVVAVVV